MSLASWFKKLFSARVAKRVERKPASSFVKLKPKQLEKLGFSPKAERYVERGARLTKKTPTISKRQFRTKETGLSPEKLAAAHRAGEREYKARAGSTPAATEEQAAKQIATKARRSQRIARRNRAAEKEGFRQGKKQSRAVREFLERNLEQHDRYLDTGRGRLDSDEYRKTVHLAYEYGFDEDRIERLKMSYTITAQAA
jgi:hypothetical protein